MTNNDILKRIRYILDLSDIKMIEIFSHAELNIDRSTVSNWLKKEEDPLSEDITDRELSIFLNGLVIEKRGKREGPLPEIEDPLSNNVILRKLKIAFNLKTTDILELFASIGKKISKHELSSFFRHPENKSYRLCMDQYLRHFLNALQAKYRSD